VQKYYKTSATGLQMPMNVDFLQLGCEKNVTFAALIVGGINIFLYLCRAVNEKLL